MDFYRSKFNNTGLSFLETHPFRLLSISAVDSYSHCLLGCHEYRYETNRSDLNVNRRINITHSVSCLKNLSSSNKKSAKDFFVQIPKLLETKTIIFVCGFVWNLLLSEDAVFTLNIMLLKNLDVEVHRKLVRELDVVNLHLVATS